LGIKIFGFGSEKWISLVGKKLPYFSNSYMDENSYWTINQEPINILQKTPQFITYLPNIKSHVGNIICFGRT
jgi:hypothetical protein